MKKLLLAILIVGLLFVSTKTVFAKNVQGEAGDPLYPGLGIIKYLGNPSGYQFWFTEVSNVGSYVAGHSYHNVYKFDLQDTTDWCGPVFVPDRAPYNLVAEVGASVYYKIWDVTTETYVCGSEGDLD